MRHKILDPRLALFEPTGYITAANSLDFQEQLTVMVNKSEYSTFLVDMSAVEFLDSAGLMVLVTAFRLAGNLGKSFNICSIPPSVKIIFELTQLDRVLSIYRDRGEFEASLLSGLAA